MFTGLVEEQGCVLDLAGGRLALQARVTLEGMAVGDSLAVNGVCLTVVERRGDGFAFDLGPETLARTTLGELRAGDAVNLERPLRLGALVGGHLVQGHVAGVGRITRVSRHDASARVTIEWQDAALGSLLIPQGSVAVDGVSLTVAALGGEAFEVMVIPHTLARTTLGQAVPGRRVNLEMDMVGKYVQRFLRLGGQGA
jgi:riboflavin synthase